VKWIVVKETKICYCLRLGIDRQLSIKSGVRVMMNRGERIANKTKSAIKKALLELIHITAII
jgi:hypothetical protein